jgi:hypothetical protein
MMDVLWWSFRSTYLIVLFRALYFDLILLRIAYLRLHFQVLEPVAR